MNQVKHVKVTSLNEHLICPLCRGYFVNATTTSECFHSFCSSCIVKHVEDNKYCPVCDTLIHETRPHENLRPDRTLQALVYKLVPGLYKKEMKNRRAFYAAHPEVKVTSNASEERGEISEEPCASHDDYISIQLLPSRRMTQKRLPRSVLGSSSSSGISSDASSVISDGGYGSSVSSEADSDVSGCSRTSAGGIYLLCPSNLAMVVLEKFIRSKYTLHSSAKVDIWHGGEKLAADFTLADIVLLYKWTRAKPLKITYRIRRTKSEIASITESMAKAALTSSKTALASVQNSEFLTPTCPASLMQHYSLGTTSTLSTLTYAGQNQLFVPGTAAASYVAYSPLLSIQTLLRPYSKPASVKRRFVSIAPHSSATSQPVMSLPIAASSSDSFVCSTMTASNASECDRAKQSVVTITSTAASLDCTLVASNIDTDETKGCNMQDPSNNVDHDATGTITAQHQFSDSKLIDDRNCAEPTISSDQCTVDNTKLTEVKIEPNCNSDNMTSMCSTIVTLSSQSSASVCHSANSNASTAVSCMSMPVWCTGSPAVMPSAMSMNPCTGMYSASPYGGGYYGYAMPQYSTFHAGYGNSLGYYGEDKNAVLAAVANQSNTMAPYSPYAYYAFGRLQHESEADYTMLPPSKRARLSASSSYRFPAHINVHASAAPVSDRLGCSPHEVNSVLSS